MKLHIEKEKPLKLELEHFVYCIQKDTCPLITGNDGLEILKIVLAAGAK